MYSIPNFLKQTPTVISTAIGTILTNIALAGWSPLTDKQNLCVVALVFVGLNLFYVAPLVSSNAKLDTLNSAQLDAIDLGKQIAPVTHVTNVNVAKPAPVKRTAKKR